MNGRDKRKKRRSRVTPVVDKMLRQCMNGCGGTGPHYVPPSAGIPGFYMCTPKENK